MKKLIGLCSLLIAINVSADVLETGTVSKIILESNKLSVFLSGADDLTDCAQGGRWTMTTDDPLFKEKYSAILAAASAGKTISLKHLAINGCGWLDSNKIYYVSF